MTPWMLLTILVALANLAALLVIRGRWGRIVLLLLPAALVGTAAGEAIGTTAGFEAARVGDFSVIPASAGAQIAMIATLLVSHAMPNGAQREDRS